MPSLLIKMMVRHTLIEGYQISLLSSPTRVLTEYASLLTGDLDQCTH